MKQRKKIVFLIPGLGIIERGAEHAVLELSKKLCRFYDVIIFSRGKVAELKLYPGIKNKTVRAISRDNKATNLIYKIHPELSKILDFLRLGPTEIEMLSFSIMAAPNLIRGKYDLLFPTNGVWGCLLCVIIRTIRKIPFVYASHGGEEPMIARLNPDVYVALTDYTHRWLNKFKANLKVVTIPNGIDTKKFNPTVKPVKIDLERPVILSVAALIPAKRIDLAIRAVGKLEKGSLLVLGDGPLHKNLEKLGKLLLGKRRFAIKKVPYEQIQHYYVTCDVFTLPSYLEPSPLVFLEAGASNIPIVSPDEERRRSVLGEAAIYCDVEDIEEYANTLYQASRSYWGERGRKVAEKYDWRKIAIQYHAVLKTVIKG